MDAAVAAAVRSALPTLRVPGGQDRVHKSECAFSFDTPESPGGLYTNLATHASVGAAFVALDRARTGAAGRTTRVVGNRPPCATTRL
jgi:ubiquitin carboxyl-terminal hydrolase 5/13